MTNKIQRSKPGRPRKFDEAVVLQQAMQAFLQNGFEASSYEDIARAMGLSKPSLYNAFGDKLALFERVLGGYAAAAHGHITSNFSGEDSLENAAQNLLCSAAEFYSSPDGPSLGCLLVGTALPSTTQYDHIREMLAQFTNALELSLEDIVTQQYAKDAKRLGKTPREISLHISSLIFSLAVRARMGLSRKQLVACAEELSGLLG